MQFEGKANEYLIVTEITSENYNALTKPLDVGLTILWNREMGACLNVDGIDYVLSVNQLIFLTEFHRVEVKKANTLRLVRFNRPFYCVIDHDAEVSCKGLLFFGASQVPVIDIPGQELERFEILWNMLSIEMQSRDNLQFEMLQMMLKRLIILCTRLFKKQHSANQLKKNQLDIVREYNFLVEKHYKIHRTVADYADLLHKSPKTLSNLFSRYNQQTPLEIIHDRILLEARRLLHYTDMPVKEIAYETGFEDIQTFSRFFKNKEGVSPSEYRENSKIGVH